MAAFKRKELELLTQLRKNSRISLTDLSKEIHMPISTIHDKMRIKTKPVIKKNTCILDYTALGFATHATILLTASKTHKPGLEEFLKQHFNVNTLYKVNSGYDFLVEVIFKSMKELESFAEELEEKFRIKKKQIYYLIDELAKEQFLDRIEKLAVLEG